MNIHKQARLTPRFDKSRVRFQNHIMIRSLLVLALIAVTTPALAGDNCTCRHEAEDVPEGAIICMRTPNGMQMAQCSRVLNNTSWKFLGHTCPVG